MITKFIDRHRTRCCTELDRDYPRCPYITQSNVNLMKYRWYSTWSHIWYHTILGTNGHRSVDKVVSVKQCRTSRKGNWSSDQRIAKQKNSKNTDFDAQLITQLIELKISSSCEFRASHLYKKSSWIDARSMQNSIQWFPKMTTQYRLIRAYTSRFYRPSW